MPSDHRLSSGSSSASIGVTVLGATGTIGVNTLDVLARHPGRFHVVALTAQRNHQRLLEQCQVHQPEYAVMTDRAAAEQLRTELRRLGLPTEVLVGEQGLCEVAALPQTHYVMAAIVGAAGLLPTLAAARAGKRVLLANKEALVMSGQLFMDEIARSGAELLPIDSEHNAVFQCMPPNFAQGLESVGVERILLTASGGPFRNLPLEQMHEVTPEQACAHPNWVMGRKISVDSATMMNKGLEVIEACWLFATTTAHIEVVLHPQSVIHSLVSYTDGSVLAQLGNPDMRTPIAHALAWPERLSSGVAPLDLIATGRLDFHYPDRDRFPCLRLAFEAFETGGTATAVLNAANEIAVEAFLARSIRFTDIARIIEHTLAELTPGPADTLERILQADQQAREQARRLVHDIGHH
ncbi:1-deoxy-D-xylulose-5-phosphate reductoisomerase [Thiorhodospira sibirica]|uniref:1-deoxy-D-xylulose-5-phosphate reductoisomerase n=1 Tax=Thiorhodospira sibirica TaxID=154347 RepID=UPI00022C33D3|nr:1-deoxy-D-xylulose-5-phosphate reductoisomerase [Thiorhodospira sibirica]